MVVVYEDGAGTDWLPAGTMRLSQQTKNNSEINALVEVEKAVTANMELIKRFLWQTVLLSTVIAQVHRTRYRDTLCWQDYDA